MKSSKMLKSFKQEMTRKQTYSERLFERRLIGNKIDYKKQLILGFYILDFVIPSKMISVEVDGGYHNNQKIKDMMRDNFINKCGYTVIRINNDDVGLFNMDTIIKAVDYDNSVFRSSLGKANAYRSVAIEKKRKLLNI